MKFIAQLSVVGALLSVSSASPGHSGRPVKNCKVKGAEQMVPWDANYATGVIPSGIEHCLAKYMGPYLLNPMYQSPPGLPHGGHGHGSHGGPGNGGPGHGGPGSGGPGNGGPGSPGLGSGAPGNGGPGNGGPGSPGLGSGAPGNGTLPGGGLGATPGAGVGGCFGCIFTVAKEVPCIYNAIKGGGFSALLQCGVGKSDVCECLNCLPDALSKYVQGWCSSNEGEGVAPTFELADDNFVANADDNIKAFLGLLSPAELQALKEKAAAANPPPPQATGGGLTSPNPDGNGQGQLGCFIGASCGGCCCVGLCVGDSTCIGGCF